MADDETLDLAEAVEIFNDGLYRAVLLDVEPFYRWFIFRKEEMLQEGVSISEEAGRRAVTSILTIFIKLTTRSTPISPLAARRPSRTRWVTVTRMV